MNWNNESQFFLTQQYFKQHRVDTLPEWARREQVYNCEAFFQKTGKVYTGKGGRKVLAKILRKIADQIYPLSFENPEYGYVR
ncbi:MAG: hypothetical protein MRZ75_03315 [Roseburia sp.]|uniref:hypothetical protein n=1 Tax=Roseburia sp. 831b TaxID=1261635 RepID=UPI0009526985|nr:hypothetical protein [Roseburia sp. 831b]MCI5918347.1 hypothetical protein [Roseburia sp.]MDD6216783.1 hypothetical protein [Roseburia sp.]MDY5884273.1 hypothetical protein [Roseburia sp.]WVK74005.1 hypothetical protein BIV16_05660 [Roseburia sp. 831b]